MIKPNDKFEAALKLPADADTQPPAVAPEVQDTLRETRKLNFDAAAKRADHEIDDRRSEALSALTARSRQQVGKSGERRIQGHVTTAGRRQQKKRESKNP